jgi:subtilisin family serine protease
MVPQHMPIRVRLVPNSPEATAAPDAFRVLQAYRATQRGDFTAQRHVALDHLMTAARHTEGSPVHPSLTQQPISSYGQLGWGGRQPVNWLGHLPARNPDVPNRRRPVVAVLDTGVGAHPWLPTNIVRLDPTVFDVTIVNPELTGVTDDPYEAVLDPDAGHGTFIAGLIRQHCADANILAIRVMGGDGVVSESALLDALWLLVLRQQMAIASGNPDELVDVVSLSLGYYHEQPDDPSFDPLLLTPLRLLGELGVAVVVAAGNDATDRPMFPAAFTPWAGGPVTTTDPNSVPVMSVGALNPNGTIALFSNAGGWVACHRPGASVVSTFPTTFNAGEQAAVATDYGGEGMRSTLDPDDFSSGFGVWSGTSFAAPVLAGQIAAQLCMVDLTPMDRESMLTRGWGALSACVEGVHR